MKQTNYIELFKENPEFFFSQLPEQAEEEITEFLRFIIFKYQIEDKQIFSKEETKMFLLPKVVKEFKPLKRDEIYAR